MTLARFKDTSGQATVELALVFPVVLIIACIAVNALLYFSYCAKFDRIFKQTICQTCTSPSYGTTITTSKSQLQTTLEETFNADNLDVETTVSGNASNIVEFGATLKMAPTLFGLGLKDEIFGVPLFKLSHSQKLSVDVYKPGVFF